MFIERGPSVEAVEAWIQAGRITPGTPLWRAVLKGHVQGSRLAAGTWHYILKRRVAQLYEMRGFSAKDAKRQAAKYATHSLRAGMITSMARGHCTLSEIRDVTGHAEG